MEALDGFVDKEMSINNIMELASQRPYGEKFAMKKLVGSIFVIVSGNFGHFPYLSMNTKFLGVVVKPMGVFINIAELH
jgi:hypothetical protein